MPAQPKMSTLLQHCSMAASGREARYRIDRPVDSTRSARIIAVDAGAAAFVQGLAAQGWDSRRFLVYVEAQPLVTPTGPQPDAVLRDADGVERRLRDELVDADTVVLVASHGDGAEAASLLGDICLGAGVMTAGIVVTPDAQASVDDAVRALRPNAMVLVILQDHQDVDALLTGLRV